MTVASNLLTSNCYILTFVSIYFRLCVTGQHVSPVHAPVASLSGSDWHESPYSFLVEEVIEEDGVYEDIIAVDYKNMYVHVIDLRKGGVGGGGGGDLSGYITCN